MAVRVREREAPRSAAIAALAGHAIPGVLTPLACGTARDATGREAQFVICRAPPGPPLAVQPRRAWTEAELLACVVRPIASALAGLAQRHATHRAIRPDNVFQAAPGQPVVIGCAWAGPPGALQPPVYEPTGGVVCDAGARGDGRTADDVYALGVLLVTLASGMQPLAGLDPAAVVARKLALGDAPALTAGLRLPGLIDDLVRGMLAEDPEHRPSPALLADPEAARARRVASRPRRRALKPLNVGGQAVWHARGLADALAGAPEEARGLLRAGLVDRWVRRELGDVGLAQSLDESARGGRSADEPGRTPDGPDADALALMRAVAVLDPLAPICWSGVRLAPDALGAALAAAGPEHEAALRHFILSEGLANWALIRRERYDPVLARMESRHARGLLVLRGWAGGLARLRYSLNPLLPCRAPMFAGLIVARLEDLLPALELVAGRADRPALPLDAETAAFLAARLEERRESEFQAMAGHDQASAALAQLRVLAQVQSRVGAGPLPTLAGWLTAAVRPVLADWPGRSRRATIEASLGELVAEGRLPAILAKLDASAARRDSAHQADQAYARLRAVDAEIAILEDRSRGAETTATRAAHQLVGAAGLFAAVATWLIRLF